MYTITNIYVLAAFGTIGGALFGFDISSMSAWIGADQYLDYFGSPDSNLQGGITASMSAGSFVGAVASGWLADGLGRRGALMIAACVWMVGAAVQCSAQNVAHLVAGRVVSGLAIGVTSSQVCVYLAELAPGRIRGRVVGIQQWAIEWGILIMYLISYGCARGMTGPEAFRVAWGVQGVPGAILLGALFFFPESPRWLAGKERWDECLDTLALLHAKGDRTDPTVLAEYDEVREAARIAAESRDVSFMGMFGKGGLEAHHVRRHGTDVAAAARWQRRHVLHRVHLPHGRHGRRRRALLVGDPVRHLPRDDGPGAAYIDRVPRRLLFLVGAAACMALHFAIAGLMADYGHPVPDIDGNANLRWELPGGGPAKGVIACSYIFVGVYGLTWAPAAWIYASEVFPLKYRAKGVGLSAATNWIFNFALAYFVAPAFTNIQWKTYIIFGVFCAAMFFHIFFTYPETAGRTLEEIDLVFETNTPPWRSNRLEPDAFQRRVEAVRHQKKEEEVEVGQMEHV
ncbi:sugar transporter [Apiospora phragmitis]|uniref:Sugar transporter n=1 Tax=Apiospora phragmitis TaxID=2905665 RepID=A0ABR1X791_9PEZI